MTNVLITGANRGLGLGFVKNYLGKNVNVVSTTRDIKGSKELLALKESFRDKLEIFELDLFSMPFVIDIKGDIINVLSLWIV